MHPSLTPEAQEEKRRDYERVPPWERQRVTKHPKTGRHRCKQKQQRRAKTKASRRTRRAQRNRR